MAGLGSLNGIHHDTQIAAGGIFHAHRRFNAAGGEPVLLVFHAAGTHGHIGQQVGKIPVVFRIKHFIGAGEIVVPEGRQV